MRAYNQEQLEALRAVTDGLGRISSSEKKRMIAEIAPYLRFRDAVEAFLNSFFGSVCTQKCYQNELSACCSREGIITFFADVVINALCAPATDLEKLYTVLEKPLHENKCVYLGERGCLWRIKPIVCEMFLCDSAQKEVFSRNPSAETEWRALESRRKLFTWPDQPVLFDALESYFIQMGYQSPLMYLHNSPGLLRVKQKAAKATSQHSKG